MTVVSYQAPEERERQHATVERLRRLQESARARAASRFRAGRDQKQVIAELAKAVEQAKPGSRRRVAAVNGLSAQLLQRFRQLAGRDTADLVTAIQLLSAEDGPAEGPAEVVRLVTLIECVEEWEVLARVAPPEGPRLEPSHVPDVDALRRRLAATASAPARHRIRVLHACARARAAEDGPAAGYDDMVSAIALLPRTAGWGLPRDKRTRKSLLSARTEHNSALTSDAAACAIAAGRPADAIELLETGRGVVWDQLLHATIRAELRAVDRGLARRLDRACRSVERHGRRSAAADRYQERDIASAQLTLPDTPYAAVTRRWTLVNQFTEKRLNRRQRRWEQAAERAQNLLPGGTFQRVRYLSDIRPAAAEGPVVAVVLSRFGCHALIVTAEDDEPQVVDLPALTVHAAQLNARQYLTALAHPAGKEREVRLQATLHWLWDAVAAPVFAALSLPEDKDGEAPRLWWCPSGPLAVLPLHAANPRPGRADAGAGVGHRVISSYTPTLRSLISARKARDLRDSSRSGDGERLLLVSVSDRAGQQDLPATTRFREFLTDLIPAHRLTTLHGPKATAKNVTRALRRHSRAHFDCHGRQDPDSAARTGLVLHDRDLTVADLTGVRTRRPEFAFLAACSTAAPEHTIIDEMVSVTSVLHYSGYQSVIGTLSPVLDSSTERVAKNVHTRLSDPQTPPGPAAALLHHAVSEERRRRPKHPSTWVPFIHVGI